MASRSPLVLLSAVFSLLPGVVFAQAAAPAAPPGIDQALRANVTEFFQDFIDGKFRQALNLVAEDTQDKYFSSPKLDMTAFEINAINYSDGFTKATVKMTVTRVWKLKAEGFLQDTKVDGPMETNWKIEHGKWVFYEKPVEAGVWATPMGPSADLVAQAAADKTAAADRKKINDETMQAEARKILDQIGQTATATGVTPGEVTLALDKLSSAKVVFHNGAPGSLSLSLMGLPTDLPGFRAVLDKQNVNANEDTGVELVYDPASGQPQVPFITIHVIVQPFGVDFPVRVNFGPAPQ
jgi:hypothetical protein